MTIPKLYRELAAWWPLLSAPADYEDEAAFVRQTLTAAMSPPPRTLLELGSGGGNLASHLKASFELTLTDRSAGMLAVSRALNPECEHHEGDMRTLDLGRRFDAVLVHDAVMYMTTEDDLRRAVATCAGHCRPGGASLWLPDFVRESFRPSTSHGGHDGDGRGLRYLEWTRDPDPADDTCVADFAYLLRERDGSVRAEHDRHVWGLFPAATWLRLLRQAGFEPRRLDDPWGRVVFVAVRPV